MSPRPTRLSTVRIAGCTASFVSPEGMILTNHHCVQPCLAQLSSPENDLLKNGFLAKGREQELRCPTQNADILMEIEDITAKVAAATAGKDDRTAGTSDPRRCESVKLYQGGQ